MELIFLALLVLLMALTLGSGFPVAFALPGSAILTVGIAAASGYLIAGEPDAFFAQGGAVQWLSAGVTNLRGVYWEAERDTLIAIPLFIFMGIMLQRSKIAEDLLVTMAQLFGPIPGGLGISVVFVGALLAATTGIVGATVVAMGLISLPAMLRSNYSRSLATGTIAASGTLGQIIPPSIVLIILADQLASAVDQASTARKVLYKASTGEFSMPSEFDVTSTSAGEMFLGAFVPGLVLVGLYMVFILGYALIRPSAAPAVHYDGAYDRKFLGKVLITLVPPLALIFMVLGSIISGVATVNQAGAIGAAGALLMAGYRLKEGGERVFWPTYIVALGMLGIVLALSFFSTNIKSINTGADMFGVGLALVSTVLVIVGLIWSGARALRVDNTLQSVMIETAKTSALVFIILMGAAMLTAAFRAFGGEDLVRHFLEGLPGGFWTKFVVVMLVIFILGFFLDFIEIAVVVVPIVAPILLADPSANVTAVWLGVMIGLNIQTSFLTPPFGFALFYLRGVAPAIVRTIEMYKGVIIFIILQLVALFIVGNTPSLVNYLPNRTSFLSDTAPPPRNPKLQYCLEDRMMEFVATDGDRLSKAISDARGIDLGVLPDDMAEDLRASYDQADEALLHVAEIAQAQKDVAKAAVAYRPLHTQVRGLEREMQRVDTRIGALRLQADRLRGEENADLRATLEERIEKLQEERAQYERQIPESWKSVSEEFGVIQKSERTARNEYRRAADGAYEPLAEILASLHATEDLRALEPELRDMANQVQQSAPNEMVDPLAELARKFGDVEGASDVRRFLVKARTELRRSTPNKDAALEQMQMAVDEYEHQLDWRQNADVNVLPALEKYEGVIRENIGARLQPKLTREQALYLASCSSGHRDISLNF